MTQATDSQIAMWRGAIALAYANGEMDAAEKKQLLEWFGNNTYLSDSQRALLTADLDRKIQLADVWGQITDRQDRAHLIDIAPALFAGHGAALPAEKALYDKMFAEQMAGIDKVQLQKDIDEIKAQIPREQAEDEREYLQAMDIEGPVFSKIGHLLYHFEKTLGIEDV